MDSADPPVARQISLYAVIQSILSHGPTSRADLAKRCPSALRTRSISTVTYDSFDILASAWAASAKSEIRFSASLWTALNRPAPVPP